MPTYLSMPPSPPLHIPFPHYSHSSSHQPPSHARNPNHTPHRRHQIHHHALPRKPSFSPPASNPHKYNVHNSSIRTYFRPGRGKRAAQFRETMHQSTSGRLVRGNGRDLLHTHAHGCIICGKESASRSSCLCSVSLGGEGVLRPGCGLWAVDRRGDGGEGEGLRMCCFGCVLMAAGIGESML